MFYPLHRVLCAVTVARPTYLTVASGQFRWDRFLFSCLRSPSCSRVLTAHCHTNLTVDPARGCILYFRVCSNAGKFTSHGIVTVDVAVVHFEDEQFLVMTVSNTRCGSALTDPESLFIPFKGTYEGTGPSAAGTFRLHVVHG